MAAADSDYQNHPLMVSARAGDDFSFTLTDWGEGIRPYDFDLPYGYSKSDETFHTVFDRALVRQGETIHMKHILRQPNGTGFDLAPGFSGTLRLSHRGSDTQFDLPLTIDANGIGETEWTAPQGAPMGDYDISVIDGDKTLSTNQSFKVDEYKLPTMRATVTGPKEAAIRPKSLPLDLFVGYLAGGGASNLPVEMRVGYFGRCATPDGYDSYTFGGNDVKEGTKPLNGDGEEESAPLPPTQTLPATLGGDGTTRTSVDVPHARLRDRHARRDGLSGRQWRSTDRVEAHPDLPLGGAIGRQDRRLADEAGRSAAELRRARYRQQAEEGPGDQRSRSTAARC